VADFGSGLGVAGLAAALAGAAEVVLLDREPMALSCGLLSAAATGIQGVTGWEQLQQQVQADMLGSGQQAAPAGVLQLAQLFATQQLQQQQSQQQQQLQQSKQQQQSQQQPSPAAAPAAAPSTQCSCIYRATPYDWTSSDVSHERFDVVLACDVLYEAEAVNDVARAIPQLMRAGSGSLLLLADPPNRTAANRQRFLEVLAAGGSSSTAAAAAGGGPPPSSSSSSSSSTQLRLLLQESALEECDVTQLDPEMLGGVNSESVAVQFMVFRAALGGETLGLKQAL
jgi:predicted nicotinamide N-methyase